MTDFTNSLIQNIGVHSTSSTNTSQLSEKLRQARAFSFTSLSQALGKNSTTTITKNNVKLPVPKKIAGQLEINVVGGRSLSITDATKSNTYCIVHCDGNVTCTLDKVEDGILPNSPVEYDPHDNGVFQPFELMMRSSSPKWMHRVTFGVRSGNKEISVYVFDRGNKLPNGEDRFLGMSSIVPSLLDKKTVELFFPLQGRLDDNQQATGNVRLQVTYNNTKKTKPRCEDFCIIHMIDQDSFGEVYEVVKRDSGRTYTMKALSKRLLVAKNGIEMALTERDVLASSLHNPFLTNLKYSFQTTNHLFLVTDYFPGGDLFDFLERKHCSSEKHCQFFIAETVCALESLHACNIVYRNLKPESILLDREGHISLTDVGLCKQLKDDKDLISEIPENIIREYLAPEMVSRQLYGKAVDWWSLGILFFELLTGFPPFHNIKESVLAGQILGSPIEYPLGSCVTDEAKDLVEKLLERDPSKRLGSSNGATEVKAHAFFKDIDWFVVSKKQMQPPFTLEVGEQLNEGVDTGTFISDIPITKLESNSASAAPIAEQFQYKFKGYSFINDNDDIVKKANHRLGIKPEDEDPEIDFWFR